MEICAEGRCETGRHAHTYQALREALINTLVHTDYNDRASILVVKEPSGLLFRNPGLLQVPVEQAIQGGASDCRNRIMQQLILMIGLGERAGSGLPKIIHGWQDTGHFLQLRESFEPYDHSVLEMLWARRDGVNDTGLDKINVSCWNAYGKTRTSRSVSCCCNGHVSQLG